MGERIGVTDEEWAVIGPLLPPEHDRGCRPAQDNRRYFEGMMWIARTGAQWRHLPDEYGKWNSVFRRYRQLASADLRPFSKAEFDHAWISAIEDSGRQDWYDPMPRRKKTRQ